MPSAADPPPRILCLPACPAVPPNICIVEELAEGGSLHQRLHGPPGARRRCPLPYGQLLRVAADVAEAMCYLHPRIVHRDLKTQVGRGLGWLGCTAALVDACGEYVLTRGRGSWLAAGWMAGRASQPSVALLPAAPAACRTCCWMARGAPKCATLVSSWVRATAPRCGPLHVCTPPQMLTHSPPSSIPSRPPGRDCQVQGSHVCVHRRRPGWHTRLHGPRNVRWQARQRKGKLPLPLPMGC